MLIIRSRFVGSCEEEHMAARRLHSMVYHEGENAMYAFGGEALDWRAPSEGSENASFNDMWKLDLVSLKWSRVVVKSSPYPLPKFMASLVVYKWWFKDELLLYGGYRPLPRPSNALNLNEIHLFNTKTKSYRQLATLNDGPHLAGHASAIHGDLFIVHGGLVSTYEVNFGFFVLDMRTKRWFTPPLPAFPTVRHIHDDSVNWPRALQSVVICMIAVRNGAPILLSMLIAFVFLEDLFKLHYLCSLVLFRYVRDVLETEMKRREQVRRYCREDEEDLPLRVSDAFFLPVYIDFESILWGNNNESEEVDHDGIKCNINNCYLSPENIQACKQARFGAKPRTIDQVTISLLVDPLSPSQISLPLDEVDVAEMRVRLRTMINQLHMKFYSTRPDVLLSPNLPSRNSSFRRLTVFTADISNSEDFNPMDLEFIEWIPQSVQYGGPPETQKYCLVAGRGEVIVHGGSVHFGENMGMMGYTYLMTPVANSFISQVEQISSNQQDKLFQFNLISLSP
uniref:Kelch motif family protein n=1 Tax=Heterorhabditis bacteriophora TaxID=37862 RepID=A0A1I7XK13_HETBA